VTLDGAVRMQLSLAAEVVIKACILVSRLDILWDDVFPRFQVLRAVAWLAGLAVLPLLTAASATDIGRSHLRPPILQAYAAADAFLAALQPHILADEVPSPAPEVVQVRSHHLRALQRSSVACGSRTTNRLLLNGSWNHASASTRCSIFQRLMRCAPKRHAGAGGALRGAGAAGAGGALRAAHGHRLTRLQPGSSIDFAGTQVLEHKWITSFDRLMCPP
jgi:hypothetical protein